MTTVGDETSSFEDQFAIGTRLLHSGKVADSIPYLKQAHQIRPDHVDTAVNLSGAYILSKQFQAATELLEPLSAQVKDNPMIWTNLGAAYLGNPVLANDEEQLRAIDAFHKAYQLSSKTPNVAYNIGLIYRDRKEYSKAIDWFERALDTNPNDIDARRILEQLRSKSNKSDT